MSTMRGLKFSVLLIALILGVFSAPSIIGTNSIEITPQALTSGTINGIDYTYGNQTFSATGNFTQTANGTVIEVSNETRSETMKLPLFTKYDPYDILFRLDIEETDPVTNVTSFSENYMFNDTYFAELDFLSNTTDPLAMPARFNSGNYTNGFELMNVKYVNDSRSTDVAVVTQNEKFLGQFPVGVTQLEYNSKPDAASTNITRFSIEVVPIVIYVNVTMQLFDVLVSQTVYSQAYMGYVMEYANAYNVSATAYQVNITDGKNLAIGVTMFDNIQANYTESVVSYLGYSFFAFEYTELKFANPSDYASGFGNETVPWEMYPRDLLPKSYKAEGVKIEAGFREVSSKLLSTYQSVTAAFASVASDITDNQANIEANLAVWGVQTLNTLAAFEDGNGNGKFDLAVDKDGIKVASSDRLAYLGLTEAYETTVVNAYYQSHVYNESVQLFGLGIDINNTNVNDTSFNVEVEQFGYGDVNADVNTVFFWNAPTTDTQGNVVFDFGIEYQNFPVTWLNLTDFRNSFVEGQDIGYNYIIKVNPDTGFAKISPTWLYGGMQNPAYKDAMKGLSLAWVVKSEFFSVQATYTATATNATLNSSSTREFGKLRVAVGSGDATEIDVTGPKSIYLLNNSAQSYTAKFDAITLLQVSGTFEGEKVTPFSSESDNTGGTATVGGLVETLNVNIFYSVSLVIISYPVWDGLDIVHDPDYTVAYAPNPAPTPTPTPTTTTDTGQSTTTSTDTSTTTETTTSKTSPPSSTSKDEGGSDASSLPGFGFYIVAVSIALMVFRRRK